MQYTKKRLFFILSVCVLTILVSLGNFFELGIFSSNKVHLGLDLKGGSQILLKIDYDTYLKERLGDVITDLKNEFRKNKIRIVPKLKLNENKEAFVVINDVNEFDEIKKIVKAIDTNLSIDKEDGSIAISYSNESTKAIKYKILQQSIEIVNRRVNETGMKEPIIQAQGSDRILVQVPGMESPDELKRVLGKTAKMTFHLINAGTFDENNLPSNILKMKDKNGYEYNVEKQVILNGELLEDANATFNEGKPSVAFTFNSIGSKKFADITKRSIGRQLGIVLDNEVITAPRINTAIFGGKGVITGDFSTESVNELAMMLRSGALPTPLDVIEERVVGPSLGEDSIKRGLNACAIGFCFVLVFMIGLYKFFGILTDITLIVNLTFTLAMLSIFNATLTLPGIAGLVLAVGMAVDTNVLIFERIKEEYTRSKKVYTSVESGFDFAWTTIFDSNITTLLIAFILYSFGTGAVKGFALVLALGILSSLFSGVMLTKLLLSLWLEKFQPKSIKI
ncbi:MAG: protein translocase subunit SecD [Rickettsiales bacterium]|jgi:preprotein translocase subunit SecD|nr:protein translocase subunit SecD [Rickettsiales bacterium]